MNDFDLRKFLTESRINEGKTQALYNLLEKVYDAGVEGVDYDENHGFSSILFQDYWRENQTEIMQMFRGIQQV